MSGIHSRIIAAAAKAELQPLGFERKGKTRVWIADRGFWLNIVQFTPSRWSISVDLDNAAHWLWAGHDFMSLDYFVRGASTEFDNENQFMAALEGIAKQAACRAEEIEQKFASFDAIAAFVINEAERSDRMRPSWFGYRAGLACGILGRQDEAEYFLRGLTDLRVASHAEQFLPLTRSPSAFKRKVNELMAKQRALLKLPPLAREPF